MKACDVTLVDRQTETKTVLKRSEKGRVSNGVLYVKVIPNAERSYTAWSQAHLRLALYAQENLVIRKARILWTWRRFFILKTSG